MEWIYIWSGDRYRLKGHLDYMILFCRADFAMYDFVMHDFSIYTGFTSRVISPKPFIHEKIKLQEGNNAVSLCIRTIAIGVFRIS